MSRRTEIGLINVTGLMQGLALVTFPAASSIFTSAQGFGFSASRYGMMFIPQVALAILASSGKVGYDLADAAYFHRELPLGADVERVHPRLADARELVATGRVIFTEGGAMSGDHRVKFGPGQDGATGDTCTCPWWGKHRGTRGPCKHVLAARIALSGGTTLTGRAAAGQAR